MASGVTLKAAGLNISPNLLELPAGSLIEAKNVIIRRDNVIESRRGFALYGEELPDPAERVKQLFTYKQRILRHYSNKLQFQNGTNNDGTVNFDQFSGNYSETETGLRIKSIEANGNFYFTTSDGIKKLSAATSDELSSINPTSSGVPKAIDLQAKLLTVLGDQESFFTQNGVVAYRILWGKKDASNNLLLGAPSESVQIYNPLTQLLILDFNNLLNRLDILKDSSGLITDGNYAQSLALNYTDTTTELESALTNATSGLFYKLDTDIVYADDNSTPANAPLTITGASYSTASKLTVTLSGASLTDYFSSGKNLKLVEFTNTNGVEINSGYSIINDLTSPQLEFTILSQEIPISSVSGSAIVTQVDHNITAAGTVQIQIAGVAGSDVNGIRSVTAASGSSITLSSSHTSGTGGTLKVYSIATVGIVAATKIESNQYRSIAAPLPAEEPPTQAQLLSLQGALIECISRLQQEQSGVIPTTYRNDYFDDLGETTTASVQLEFSVPEGIDTSYFYQVYRTAVTTPPDTEALSSFNAGDEMALVYESFPTASEISLKKVVFADETPDIFRGANLYTNPTTGEGILQANDQPPFAKDINTFKNSIFYANTKTKQRYSLALIGVEQMISNYSTSDTPNIIITDGTVNNQYEFILGQKETSRIELTYSSINSSGVSSYFTLNSANNQTEYYIWYQKGTSTDPSSLPALSGKTGIKIIVTGSDTDLSLAKKTISALAPYAQDFSIVTGANATISIANPGVVASQNHGLINGQTIKFTTTGALPTGLIVSTTYYVVNKTNDTFQVSSTSGGPAIDTTGSQSGVHSYEIQPSNCVLIQNTNEGAADNTEVNTKTFIPANVDIGTETITVNSHGFVNDMPVQVSSTGTLPSPLSSITTYYIISATTNTFQISTSVGGSAIDLTTQGTGIHTIYSYNGIQCTTVIDGVGEDASANQVLLSQSLSPSIAIEETAKSLVRVINRSTTSNIYAYYTSGINDTPGRIFLEKRELDDLPFYLLADSSIVGDSFTPTIAPEFAINGGTISSPSPSVVQFDLGIAHGYSVGDKIIILDTDSDPTYNGIYTITAVPTTNRFQISATTVTTSGTRFSVSKTSDSEFSSNEEQKHRVYYSKTNQPEAVPILNYFDVGASDKKILRIFPLRDSLFVFKEDGLFRVSGESPPFVQALFDSSCILLAPDSLGISNNLIYSWTTQGISAVSEAGVTLASRPIDTEVLEIASSRYTNFKTATFGVGYDSDNSYIVWTVAKDTDIAATQAYRYSNLTSTWTKFDLSKTCGIVSPIDDRLYLGAGDVAFIEQERKLFNRTDYADRQFDSSIDPNSYVDGVLKLPSVLDYDIGDVIVQEQTITTYDFNSLLRKLDIDPGLLLARSLTEPDDYFYNTFNVQSGDNLKTSLLALATYLDTLPLSHNNYNSSISIYSGTLTNTAANPTVITTSPAHNLFTGRVVTITNSNSTRNINGTFEITVTSPTTFTIPLSVATAGTLGNWITDEQDFRDLKVCYNKIITLLNTDTVVSFTNYQTINTTSYQETPILAIDKVFKKLTLVKDLNFIEGKFTAYKAIDTAFTYAPASMGNALSFKHMREATLMFIDKRFTAATLSFSSDLLPVFVDVDFIGNGPGLFGNDAFGENFFGGVSHSAPFRTYIPRQCQRCRYLNIRFNHVVAREKYSILGISLTGNVDVSTRAYR
jgi:hypothetical protein